MVKHDKLAGCVENTTMCFPINLVSLLFQASNKNDKICFSHSFGRGILRNEDGTTHSRYLKRRNPHLQISCIYKAYARENPPPKRITLRRSESLHFLVPVTFGGSWCYLLVFPNMTGSMVQIPHGLKKGSYIFQTVHFPAYVSFGTGFLFLTRLISNPQMIFLEPWFWEKLVCLKGRSGNGFFEIFLEIYLKPETNSEFFSWRDAGHQ